MSSEDSDDMEYSSDNECEYDDYYNIGVPDVDIEPLDRRKTDPEHLEYVCLDTEAVEKLLNETVEQLSTVIKVSPALAKVLLLEHKWRIADVVDKWRQNAAALMIFARIKPPQPAVGQPASPPPQPIGRLASPSTPDPSGATATATAASPTTAKPATTVAAAAAATHSQLSSSASSPLSTSTSSTTSSQLSLSQIHVTASSSTSTSRSQPNISHHHQSTPTPAIGPSPSAPTSTRPTHCCPVCIVAQPADAFYHLACAHSFCRDCWTMHFETQVQLGASTAIGCMATRCDVRVPEELVLQLLTKPAVRDKYQQFAFLDYVKAHPELRFCPGPNCQTVVRSADTEAPKKATCTVCATSFCYRCGTDYHAPTACRVIRRWLTKCADDSETANYISAHTKDCPKCHICIEKNGGCNHMQCFNCKHDFCWMCVGDWKTHGSEYYECSRYKENPNIANESVHVQAREALKKYLHYYERWENHSKSLQLEQQTVDRLKSRINKKVMKSLGTWIDWQHLFNAAALLARCRYTLQYTYPYAYFMEAGPRKELFEYQQAQLEAEIENLSWKIERAETTDRGDLENQMDVAEKRRITLIKDFFPTEM